VYLTSNPFDERSVNVKEPGDESVLSEPIAWTPDQQALERSRVLAFCRKHGIAGYDELLSRAAAQPEWFWEAVVDHLGISWSRRFDSVLDLSDGIEWPHWFNGGRMNYVTSAVSRYLPERASSVAIRWEGDDGATRDLTFGELEVAINRACNALQTIGVKRGDRVGIFMPMLPETAVAMLACGKLGAIFVPIFSGFGTDAVANRLQDAGASTLITADGFYRRGRTIDMLAVARAAVRQVDGLSKLVVIPRTGDLLLEDDPAIHDWNRITEVASDSFKAVDTAADEPFMLIYTSGTTGKPKGAVHVHAGFPVKAAMDLAFSFDMQTDETLFWLTDLGWMMGPWAIAGGLIAGGSVLLFEGTPDYPAPDRLWQLVQDHDVSILGISPTAIRALMAHGESWLESYLMPSLRAIGSTGEPWNPEPWHWTMNTVGRNRCPIVNYSGGTEIGGGIIGASTIHPQKACSFTGPVPGIDADVVDPLGNPLRGEVGELVIRSPWVGMTSGFWNDRERYLEAYWSKIPGVWVHGDWSLIDDDGYWYILGRSDDTLNVAGKRVGPAEVESAAVAHPAVREAAAIGVPHDVKGEAIVVFAILNEGFQPGEALQEQLLSAIARQLGRPLRPQAIHAVSDLPKTRNAKIMRRVIRAAYLGHEAGDLTALENPEAVTEIANLADNT
jgi:acetyl-CoA synthetase